MLYVSHPVSDIIHKTLVINDVLDDIRTKDEEHCGLQLLIKNVETNRQNNLNENLFRTRLHNNNRTQEDNNSLHYIVLHIIILGGVISL